MISMAPGSRPDRITRETASPAACRLAYAASTVRYTCGRATSRSVISSATPNSPSDPTNSPARSGPACSRLSPPSDDQGPVGEHCANAKHVVRGHAVPEAVRAAGVERDVAANRADLLARRVGRVVEPVRRRQGLSPRG